MLPVSPRPKTLGPWRETGRANLQTRGRVILEKADLKEGPGRAGSVKKQGVGTFLGQGKEADMGSGFNTTGETAYLSEMGH